jgi:DNA-directed RNA polymerase delta subunit
METKNFDSLKRESICLEIAGKQFEMHELSAYEALKVTDEYDKVQKYMAERKKDGRSMTSRELIHYNELMVDVCLLAIGKKTWLLRRHMLRHATSKQLAAFIDAIIRFILDIKEAEAPKEDKKKQ